MLGLGTIRMLKRCYIFIFILQSVFPAVFSIASTQLNSQSVHM